MSPSQSDRLMAIGDNECVAFHDAYTAFVDVQSRGHRETWPVRSREFTLWLQHRYFHAHRGAPNRAALRAALDMVEAQGRFEGAHKRVFRRVASLGNRLYLDLANSAWKGVEIGATGWRVGDRREPGCERRADLDAGEVDVVDRGGRGTVRRIDPDR